MRGRGNGYSTRDHRVNTPQLLSPWNLLWLGSAVAIAALYLLRPRSRRVEVSSIFLWRRAIAPETARSPLTFLRRHFLIILQILAAILAAIALGRPAIARLLPVGRTLAVIIDTSVPMLASDGDPRIVADGPFAPATLRASPPTATRLDEAKARASVALSRLRPGDRAVVIGASGDSRVIAAGIAPDDLATLDRAIGSLVAQPSEINLAQALEVAGAQILEARHGEILILTGGVAEVSPGIARPAVPIQVVRTGRGSPSNTAITALVARRAPVSGTVTDPTTTAEQLQIGTAGRADDRVQVFVRISNNGPLRADGTLRLRVDGAPFGERIVSIGPDASEALAIDGVPATANWIEAFFDHPDLLAIDNLATAAVPRPFSRRVALVGGRTDQLERALRAVPGVTLDRIDPNRYDPTARYDVTVFEAWFPPKAPASHWMLIDPPRTEGPVAVNGLLGRRSDGSREWNSAQIARILPSPLLAGVDLAGVQIAEARQVLLPRWAEEAVSARNAPLIFLGYPSSWRAVVVAFDLRSSNLLGRVGFPVLIANSIDWLTGTADARAASNPANDQAQTVGATIFSVPGQALLINPLPRTTSVTVQSPGMAARDVPLPQGRSIRFLDTARPGAYIIREFENTAEIASHVEIARAIPVGREVALADLRPRPSVFSVASVGPGSEPGPLIAGRGETSTRDEWWMWVALTFLGIVAVEWWWYHRNRVTMTLRSLGARDVSLGSAPVLSDTPQSLRDFGGPRPSGRAHDGIAGASPGGLPPGQEVRE
ncbi:MAG: hypothetical protein EXR45_07930 [Chloroflexi bacterium]|nr:hypothetical protein [Chloroflexota bacterium]